MSDFDGIAENYIDIINNTIVCGGENALQYFAEYKAFYLEEIITGLLGKQKRLKILDYGCGVGLLSFQIWKKNPDICIHGFDISVQSIEHVPEIIKRKKNNLFTCKLDELDKDYDLCILSNVLHHVELSERTEVLGNIIQRLRKGGVLVLIEHNMKNPLTYKSVKDCPFDADAHMLSVRSSENLLRRLGFRKIFKRYITFFPARLSKLRFIDKFIGWVPLGAQYMICAIK